MLSLCELRRAARILRSMIQGALLRRVMQPDSDKLVLLLEGFENKWSLLLSCKPATARICLTHRPDSVASSGSFHEYMQAHLRGCTVDSVECATDSRQINLRLRSRSKSYVLVLSILGARSNIYLLDAEGKLAHALRSLDETRNELKLGEPYVDPRGSAPSEGEDRWKDVQDSLFMEAVERTYRQQELWLKAELLARPMQQAIKKEKAFLDRKSVNLREDLGAAKQAEAYKQKGELLKSVLHTIQPGSDSAIATDYETGESVDIPLDPQLSPTENLELYFAHYQKQSRGILVIAQQLEELGFARSELEALEQRLIQALQKDPPDIALLESLEKTPGLRRLIQRYVPPKRHRATAASTQKKDVPARLLPKRYRTQEGLEIWVGRNDEGNDYLTTRLARGNDFFFHLEGYPGSHVVLRTEGRTEAPAASLLDACELAVHFSKMKNSGRADVHVAPIKDVHKPKGAKPGLVHVRSGKTVHLKRDAKRLQSILAARID